RPPAGSGQGPRGGAGRPPGPHGPPPAPPPHPTASGHPERSPTATVGDRFPEITAENGSASERICPSSADGGQEGRGVEGNNERLLTPGEGAALFRVDPKTVTRWAASGRISSIRTPGGHRRFREAQVRALLRGEAAGSASTA